MSRRRLSLSLGLGAVLVVLVVAARQGSTAAQVTDDPRILLLPEFRETKVATSTDLRSIDTRITATNAASLPTGTGGGATLEVYLYDAASGDPLQGQVGVICKPCTFSLGPKAHVSVSIEQLAVQNAGGLNGIGPLESTTGYALFRITGPDRDYVGIEVMRVSTTDTRGGWNFASQHLHEVPSSPV